MQKRINIPGLKQLSLERPACIAALWQVSRTLDFRRVPTTLTGKCGSLLPKQFKQTIWFILNTCFPSGSLEFWQLWKVIMPNRQTPNKNPGARVSSRPRWAEHSMCVAAYHCQRKKHIPSWFEGESRGNLGMDPSRLLLMALFPLVVTVMYYNHECNCS